MQCFLAAMDAPQRRQLDRIKTLHADGQAIDAKIVVAAELFLLDRAGIGLQRNLDIIGKIQLLPQPGKQISIGLR